MVYPPHVKPAACVHWKTSAACDTQSVKIKQKGAPSLVSMLAQKEKKRVRWAETDDVLDDRSIRQPAAKVPRLSSEGGPALGNAGALQC